MIVLLFMFLSVTDVFLTIAILAHGGYELNPLFSYLISTFGWFTVIALKLGIATLFLFSLSLLKHQRPKFANRLGWLLTAVMTAVVTYQVVLLVLMSY